MRAKAGISMPEVSGFPSKNERIRIRCDHEVLVQFKKVAAEFNSQEEAIKALMDLYEKCGKTRVGPQVK